MVEADVDEPLGNRANCCNSNNQNTHTHTFLNAQKGERKTPSGRSFRANEQQQPFDTGRGHSLDRISLT